jgi:hypothetical protein
MKQWTVMERRKKRSGFFGFFPSHDPRQITIIIANEKQFKLNHPFVSN